jgi:hypothetical protein
MELMENQHKKESNEAQMIIDDLNHKIEALTVSIRRKEGNIFIQFRYASIIYDFDIFNYLY